VSGLRIVAFIAVHIDHKSTCFRNLTEFAHGLCTIRHGALEVRYSTNNVYPKVQCSGEQVGCPRISKISILWKGDQLKVEICFYGFPDVQQSMHGGQFRIADIYVTTNSKISLSHSPAAQGEGALLNVIDSEMRFEFRPQSYALEQGATLIDAGSPVRQRRIHVKVTVNERGGDQLLLGIYFGLCLCLDMWLDQSNPAILAGDINRRRPVYNDSIFD
jgi:hypothetical protein